jgi:hypothetical protein
VSSANLERDEPPAGGGYEFPGQLLYPRRCSCGDKTS